MIYIFTSQETGEKKKDNVIHSQRCSLVAKLLFRKEGCLKSQTRSFHSLYSKQIHQALAQKKVNNQPAIRYSLMMQEAISESGIFKSNLCHGKMHLFRSH